jgi:plastocyanin
MKPAALCFLALAACSRPPEPKTEKPKTQPVEYFKVDPATAGAISGKIMFTGAKPPRKPINMDSDAGCPGKGFDEPVITGKGGGLANAFVYIQSGLEGRKFEPAQDAAMLDQHGCMFSPRVIGMRAGQTLDVKNSDTVSHNIHPMPTNNREWNQQQSPGSPDLEHKFPRPDVMIPVKCNVHAWMHAYIGVVDHPYFAVTGMDGSFQWKNVPPGDYTIAVWHETLGELKQAVHVDNSGAATVALQYRQAAARQ